MSFCLPRASAHRSLMVMLGVFAAALCFAGTEAQDERIHKKANYSLASRITANRLMNYFHEKRVNPVWLEKKGRFLYALRSDSGFSVYLVDPDLKTKEQVPLHPHSTGQNTVEFSLDGRSYQLNLRSGQMTVVSADSAVKQWENRSPDGKFSVFAKNHNLYLYSVFDPSKIKPITMDGELYHGYGRVSDAFFQKNKNRDFGSPQESNTIWSSDSRQIYFFRSDYRKVKDLWVINSLSRPRPELISYKSRLPGEPLPRFNHAVYNLDLNQIVEIEEENMWKPFDLDPEKKYPLVAFVYPGPQDEGFPLTFFNGTVNNHIHLAQYGFVVIWVGNRGGSYKRPLEYSEYYRGNMRDYPLEDNKRFIEQLAERYPFIDINRIGIWGGSSGGFEAAAAMFSFPDFYKVGVTRSGLHDPSLYQAWWNDLFQGMKNINGNGEEPRWEAVRIPGNLELASRLKGRLLILHSEMDINCHPAHAARLADALMAAGKRFDYFVVPGAGHMWGSRWQYEQRLIWDYFIRNLMGDERRSVNLFENFKK